MRLRTVAGAYAGQIRDYDYLAGQAALRTGTAERLDAVRPETVQAPPVRPVPPSQGPQAKRRQR
jgi:hypothetical protein